MPLQFTTPSYPRLARVCFAAMAMLVPATSFGQAPGPPGSEAALGFTTPGEWHSVPQAILDAPDPADLWCSHELSGVDWKVNKVSVADLDSGLQLSTAHVKEGQYSGLWKDHELFPTIACWDIPHDWSADNAFEISIYSEVKTGETVTIGLKSDSGATHWSDYYLYDFTVDWTGWRTLRVPFAAFRSFEQPAGWNKIDGIYFFTKIFRHQPNPYTSLSLDAIHLIHAGDLPAVTPTVPDPFLYQDRYEDQPPPLNHPFPETTHPEAFTEAISQQTYFRGVRALYKYYPRFAPGYPSFDPNGKAYINAGETIEWLDSHGQWTTSDIKSVLVDWARKQGWAGLYNAWGIQGADPMIRFDRDGCAYVMEQVAPLDSAGNPLPDWKTRSTLLLYSRDSLKTWTVYKLPDRIATFEKLDGHNQDCLNRPPVILLGDYKYFPQADQAGYVLIPEKLANGSLRLPQPVQYAPNCIEVNYHSGDANIAITHGHTVYIVFGWCPEPALQKGDWHATMPPIPPNHPGLSQEFDIKPHDAIVPQYSKNGVPTYVVAYDIDTHKVTAPIYIGSGGAVIDDHNWPAITIDSHGIITVAINGHHNPLNMTHTLRPYDISAWSAPAYVLAGTTMPNLSYATLTCGNDDTLYTVHRSTKDLYNNHLGLYIRPPGQAWEPEKTLVAPFKIMYKVWYQRMTYDTKRDRLFLTYFSDGSQEWYTWDMYAFYNFIWPDKEKLMNKNFGQSGVNDAGPVPPGKFSGAFYDPGATEITTIVSEDHGRSWHLATTADFAQ